MHYVYHPHHEPVIVSPEEYQHYLQNGWFDSPAKFSAQKDDGLSDEDEQKEPKVDAARKRKGRPPKVKAEEVEASVDA